MVSSQNTYYGQYREIGEDFSKLGLEQIEGFARLMNEGHERLHELIYTEIRADRLPRNRTSSFLNVNRGLYNSNVALISAVASFVMLEENQHCCRYRSLKTSTI